MLASEVIKRYEAYCPQELSMEGDVRGLQVGTLQKDIHKVMVALDIREQTVAEAIAHGVDLIIVKHAPIFRPIKDLVADRAQNQIYINLIKHDIAVYVSHTNIDIVPDGLNDWFSTGTCSKAKLNFSTSLDHFWTKARPCSRIK